MSSLERPPEPGASGSVRFPNGRGCVTFGCGDTRHGHDRLASGVQELLFHSSPCPFELLECGLVDERRVGFLRTLPDGLLRDGTPLVHRPLRSGDDVEGDPIPPSARKAGQFDRNGS